VLNDRRKVQVCSAAPHDCSKFVSGKLFETTDAELLARGVDLDVEKDGIVVERRGAVIGRIDK